MKLALFTLFPLRQIPLPQAEDLDSIITVHREYVSTIFDRCLLNKKVGSVMLGVALLMVIVLCVYMRLPK